MSKKEIILKTSCLHQSQIIRKKSLMMDYYKTKVTAKDDLERILDDYYDERWWILKRVPTKQKLSELGLEEYVSFLG